MPRGFKRSTSVLLGRVVIPGPGGRSVGSSVLAKISSASLCGSSGTLGADPI